jgi:hypothetical protein
LKQIETQATNGPFCARADHEHKLYASFDLVRNVMYKYSKRAQELFFEELAEAFFFVLFA